MLFQWETIWLGMNLIVERDLLGELDDCNDIWRRLLLDP